MITIYGMKICPHCIEAMEKLDEKKIEYEFLDFSDKTENLKKFLKIRDTNEIFNEIRGEEKIGIPCFVLDDGMITLDFDKMMEIILN